METLVAEEKKYKNSILEIEKELSDGDDTLVIELVDSQPSGFIMDGPGTDDFEKMDHTAVISFPSLRAIRRVSRVLVQDKVMKTQVYKKIRYIKGCSFIDMDKQISQGIQPNALADIIVIKNGHAEVTKKGDIGLYLYLSACEFNANANYRPEDAEDVFKVIDTTIDTQHEEETIDSELAALNYLNSLKTKKGNATDYNSDAIEFLCSLFKLPSFESGFESEAWVALAQKARQDPPKFITSIMSSRSTYESEVYQAIQFGVITIENEISFFTDGNKKIATFKRDDNVEQKGQDLVDFMSSPRNKMYYDEMRVRLRAVKETKTDL